MTREGRGTENASGAVAPGSVWPVAALFGAASAASAALGAWLAALFSGATRPWVLLDWVAEHALWGTLVGALLALVVCLGARFDPSLREAGPRRAAAARLVVLSVALGVLATAGGLAGPQLRHWQLALPALAGAGLGLAAMWILLGRGLAGGARFQALPRLDPARVAAFIALLTLPLAQGVRHAPEGEAAQASIVGGVGRPAEAPASLLDAWQVMLGG